MMIQSMHHSANDDAQLDNPDHMLYSHLLDLSYKLRCRYVML